MSRTSSRAFRPAALITAGVAVALIAACTSPAPTPTTTSSAEPGDDNPFAALYEEAKADAGPVIIYTNQQQTTGDDFNAEWAAMFPEAPPLQVVAYAGADSATRYGAEREAGSCAPAAYLGDIRSSSVFADEGFFLEQDDDVVPTRADLDDKFKTDFYTVASIIPHIVLYNTDNVTDKPDSLEALLDPANEDRIGLGDPRAQLPDLGAMKVLLDQLGEDGLEDLAALNPKYYNSAVPGSAAVASGEINFYYPTYNILYNTNHDAGAPVGKYIPAGLTGAFPVIGISDGDGCNQQASARLFAAFVLSPMGQAIIGGPSGNGSVNPVIEEFVGVVKTYPAPADLSDVTIDTPEVLEESKQEILDALGLQ